MWTRGAAGSGAGSAWQLHLLLLAAGRGRVVAVNAQPPTGYDAAFLPGADVPLPGEDDEVKADYAPTRSGEHVRHYTHFSLAMSASRRFARWVAWNIDGSVLSKRPRKGIKFVLDREFDATHQIGDELYSNNRLDRGHIARRADLIWGDPEEAQQANVDSFFFTNITPQLDAFNQESKHGLWGELEDAIFDDVDVDDLRVSLIGGPIYGPTDLKYREVLVPRSFFKVIAYVENGSLRAKGFILTQDDLEAGLESLGLEEFKVFQVPLSDLEARTGLSFGDLKNSDTLQVAPGPEEAAPRVRRIRSADDYAAD
jgi:endonuclease G